MSDPRSAEQAWGVVVRNVAREGLESRQRGEWFKSSASADGGCCVEVRILEDSVLVRDSKYGSSGGAAVSAQPVLSYTLDEWQAFLVGVKSGEFDI